MGVGEEMNARVECFWAERWRVREHGGGGGGGRDGACERSKGRLRVGKGAATLPKGEEKKQEGTGGPPMLGWGQLVYIV